MTLHTLLHLAATIKIEFVSALVVCICIHVCFAVLEREFSGK